MSRLELSTRYLRSLLVVYLGRDKDQRLTLIRLAEVGVNMNHWREVHQRLKKAVFSVSSTRN